MSTKPLLTIGMIFKNEIRCLERCMKSLEPLREAVPCELVMADTGSTDGSREIAAKYADILFDFPWINDFSAARNAVMDRSSGKWYLTIDSDEWLDEDISELLRFLRSNNRRANAASLFQRNYQVIDGNDNETYSDFRAIRILDLDTGIRYQGTIHEAWNLSDDSRTVFALKQTVLHHDGYAVWDSAEMAAKRERNMALLREQLEENPDNLRALLQCIESSEVSEDFFNLLRNAIEAVKRKSTDWQHYGPPILRYAVRTAINEDLPEQESWLALAEELFPNSPFTRIDIEYYGFWLSSNKEDYEDCLHRGERYLQNVSNPRISLLNLASAIYCGGPDTIASVQLKLAAIYLEDGQNRRVVELLESLDYTVMDVPQTKEGIRLLCVLHARTEENLGMLLLRFYRGISSEKPSKKQSEERMKVFLLRAASAFDPKYIREEDKSEKCVRHAYTLLAPLEGQLPIGTAAAIMETEDRQEIERLFETVENLDELPAIALQKALLSGVAFPKPGRYLETEKLEILVQRLDAQSYKELALRAANLEDMQVLAWVQWLALAAVRTCRWRDIDQDMELAERFAAIEGELLPRYYGAEMLREENINILPPMHRFGWYCAQAFEALGEGNAIGYVQLLEAGLKVNPSMKDMVKFLTEHTPQLQPPPPSGELLALAEQVRAMLSAYAPGDPAVEALKASPAYQKVAHLIEGPEISALGILAQ